MSKTDTPRTSPPVVKIDTSKPFFLTFRQTEKRTIVKPIQGDNSADFGLAKVMKAVTAESARLKVSITVLGPQIGNVEPPKPAPPVFVGMSFGEKK